MAMLLSLINSCLPSRARRQPRVTSRPNHLPENSSPTLASLPTELLLHTASFLPASSIACLRLTSKYYYATLRDRHDLRMQQDPDEKARLVRLLEKDFPHMLACYTCNILFDWRKKPRWCCPNHDHHLDLNRGSLWCYVHHPALISREMVDAFLRGYEKGPKYGPQLRKLTHKCKGDGGWYPTKGQKIARRLDARVQLGKLVLHGVYTLRIRLPPDRADSFQGYVDRSFRHTVLPEVVKFNGIGCIHLKSSLPLLLIDAVRNMAGGFEARPICLDLINCGYCATDMRVRAVIGEDTFLTIEMEMWRSLGGRDPATRHPLEDAHFKPPGLRHEPLDLSEPPSRNLEDLFNGEVGHPGEPREGPQNRQTWLQVWMSVYGLYDVDLWHDLISDDDSSTGVPNRARHFLGWCERQ